MLRRLKPGAKFLGKKPGDYVDLTESQSKAFDDLFEQPASGVPASAAEENGEDAGEGGSEDDSSNDGESPKEE